MFLSNWHLALKLSSTALLLIFFFPSYIWPATDKNTTPIPVPPSRTTTSALETTPSATAISEKIWYKLGPRGLTQQAREWINSCLDKNPAYESEFLTDLSGDAYVKEKFAHRPDIVGSLPRAPVPYPQSRLPPLPAPFQRRRDLQRSRRLVRDTPIRDWIPAQYKEDASVIVGWEFDVGWGDGFVRQFATWAIMARPRSPHILMVLDDILEGLREKTEEHNVTIANMTWTMVGDVVDLTGPRRMTRSILKSLKATLGGKFDERSIAALYEPKLVGDVLILPGYSFALSSNHYKPEDKQGPALVTHHFDGS